MLMGISGRQGVYPQFFKKVSEEEYEFLATGEEIKNWDEVKRLSRNSWRRTRG